MKFFINKFEVLKSYKEKRSLWQRLFGRTELPKFHYDIRIEYSGGVLKPGFQFIIEGGLKFMVKTSERLVSINRDTNFAEAFTIDRTIIDLRKEEKPDYGVVTSKTNDLNG